VRSLYGDTDSIFIKFPTKDLQSSINLAKQAAEKITSLCRKPYKIEYEKTFFPFIIFCRKRYIGLMYEDDIKKCKRKFMGIALKRRDSAPIVKDVYGGALDILLEQRSLKNAQVYVRDMLSKLMENKFPLEKFVITKQLRDDYKNPGQIAHRVLADRMCQRDPGNKPQVGDRLAFIYVDAKKDEKKQGDRIEEVSYVRSKNLKPDVEFYISNQIQNPLAQLFALGIHEIDGYKEKKYPEFPDLDEEESTLKVLSIKEKELDSLIFLGAPYLKKLKRGPMDRFFTRI
jgi:DNA polymerase elongation subunit (family B)